MERVDLVNSKGVRVGVLSYGGILTHIEVPDRYGQIGDVVLGFDDSEDYESKSPYFGAIIGRYGNRIAAGKFTLKGKEYELVKNNGPNNLHGGPNGFDKVNWEILNQKESSVALFYRSRDGDQGFPGTLDCTVEYRLNEINELRIDYRATTNKTTIVNLTNHSYFNLNNAGGQDIRDHEMELLASSYTPVDENQIPSGEIKSVKGTEFDFLKVKSIGKDCEHIGGYDHNFVLDKGKDELSLVARVFAPETGRVLEVLTTEPGVQFFTPTQLDLTGKGGKYYGKWPGFCLETQHFPDSPNQPQFPSVVLNPGERYESTTIYRFKVIK